MVIGLQLTLAHYCDVCKKKWDEEKRQIDIDLVALFGAKKYYVCPCCQRIMEKPSAAYKKRADKYVKRVEKAYE